MKNLFTHGQSIQASTEFDIEVGGLYVYLYRGELTIHRLLEIKKDICIFKGDMSLLSEEVRPSEILGRVKSPAEFFFKILSGIYQRKFPRPIRGLAKTFIILSSKFVPKPV